jgi:transposase
VIPSIRSFAAEDSAMMGERMVMQDSLFYEFRLEDHVPTGHQLRTIDRFVDLSDLRRHLASFYSAIGRPSIDPELMIRMLIVGYCYGIRSERRLCEEVHLNLAYRWFCRLGLEGQVPDHSTFSRNRHGRFSESDVFRHLFETGVKRCIAEGLVGGQGFAVDASLIEADANRQRSIPGSDWNKERNPETASRSVRYIWQPLMTPPGAQPRTSSRSSSRRPIRRRNGLARSAARRSSPTPTTISSTRGLPSLSMSKPRAPFARPKSA